MTLPCLVHHALCTVCRHIEFAREVRQYLHSRNQVGGIVQFRAPLEPLLIINIFPLLWAQAEDISGFGVIKANPAQSKHLATATFKV